MPDISVFKHSNISTLTVIQTGAAKKLRKESDKRALTVIWPAVPIANVVEVSGGTLADTALNEGNSILEDLKLTGKTISRAGGDSTTCAAGVSIRKPATTCARWA